MEGNMDNPRLAGGETAEYADGEWTSYSYRLFKEGNTLKLATIA